MVKTIAALAVLLGISLVPASAARKHTKTDTNKAAQEASIEAPKLTPPNAIDPDASSQDGGELVVQLDMPSNLSASPATNEKPVDVSNTVDKVVEQPQDEISADSSDQQLSPKERARAQRRTRLVREALSYRGTPYVWGGEGRYGFDCSGFTQCLYAKRGIKLPHSARMQYDLGTPVAKADLHDGDLVFFNTRGPITHVGMYIGNGQFVHAANPRRGVVVSAITDSYYSSRFAGARRYTK